MPPRSVPRKPALRPATPRDRKAANWFALLFAAICLEGLGRRYVRIIPGEAFYFLKDAVLLYGLFTVRIDPRIRTIARLMYRPFGIAAVLTLVITVIQALRTSATSVVLAAIGLRAYWLWWLAVPLVAQVLLSTWVHRRAVLVLSFIAAIVAYFAVLQFSLPGDAAANIYAVQDGQEVKAFEVATTGRTRVSSTFSFITGFTDFVVLVPALLLSLGLAEPDRKVRTIATSMAILSAAVLPMSGSRAPFLIGIFLLALVAREAGFLFTPLGRRIMVAGAAAIALIVYVFPDSLQGIKDRFNDSETGDRMKTVYTVLPPVALATFDYPVFGLGIGMQATFRERLGVTPGQYEAENETGRYLIELGVPGYLAIWAMRLGMVVALLKAARIFRRLGRRAAAGAAISYAMVTFYGNLVFDHVWQALYLVGLGFILRELVVIWPTNARVEKQSPPGERAPTPAPSGGSP